MDEVSHMMRLHNFGRAPARITALSGLVAVKAQGTGKPAGRGTKAKKHARVEASASALKAGKCL